LSIHVIVRSAAVNLYKKLHLHLFCKETLDAEIGVADGCELKAGMEERGLWQGLWRSGGEG
jgi:hypothetical protein